jgi:hypothetical protein
MIQSIRRSGECATFLNATRNGIRSLLSTVCLSAGPRDSEDPERKDIIKVLSHFQYHKPISPSIYGPFLLSPEECVPSRGHRDGVARIRFSAVMITISYLASLTFPETSMCIVLAFAGAQTRYDS